MPSPELTIHQFEVLAALVRGASVTAAARSAGLHRTTIHHWIRTSPLFRIMLHDARQSRAAEICDRMYDLASTAFDTVAALLNDTAAPAAVRLRAALTVIEKAAAPPPEPPSAAVPLSAINAAAAQLFGHDSPPAQSHPAPNPPQEPAPASSPNPVHHNSSLFINKSTNSSADTPPPRQTPRNALCPCGSGVTYQRCCGWNPASNLQVPS